MKRGSTGMQGQKETGMQGQRDRHARTKEEPQQAVQPFAGSKYRNNASSREWTKATQRLHQALRPGQSDHRNTTSVEHRHDHSNTTGTNNTTRPSSTQPQPQQKRSQPQQHRWAATSEYAKRPQTLNWLTMVAKLGDLLASIKRHSNSSDAGITYT